MNPARCGRAILALAAVTVLLCPAAALAARPLTVGFYDSQFTGPEAATWLQRAAAAGSQVVRIEIGWVAPDTTVRPAGFDARNPADPHYNFAAADKAIRLATQDGLRVIATFTGAPPWAEGRGRPADVAPGSWRPDPRALEDYGVALGRRYSGRFPDPANPGQTLPRVFAFQPWNEPNLDEYLTPQWTGGRTASPAIYRAMLNGFYRGVKSVDRGALVVTAGTAPFGDPQPGGARIMPARFWRDLLCVRQVATGLAGAHCPDPAHFDVLAHHPYSVGSPDTAALNADDVSIPDIGKLTAILRTAERTGGALPHIHHPVWVTEVSYNSSPPNPYGVPVAEEARWLERTLQLLWTQGVSLITWNTIVDQPPFPSYSATSQAGIFFIDGRRKPAWAAFRFPLVAWRLNGATLAVWGRAPVGGRLEIQRAAGSKWKTRKAMSVSSGRVFVVHISWRGSARLRALVGDQASLAWTVK